VPVREHAGGAFILPAPEARIDRAPETAVTDSDQQNKPWKNVQRTFNPYKQPELAAWLGSMEGVGAQAPSTPSLTRRGSSWRQRQPELFDRLGVAMPGAALAVGLAIVGRWVSVWLGEDLLGFDHSPVSVIMATIVLGLLIRNTIGLPKVYEPGLRVCVRTILRVGIALLGIRLSLVAAGRVGLVSLPIILGCIGAALGLVTVISRWLGVPRRLGRVTAGSRRPSRRPV